MPRSKTILYIVIIGTLCGCVICSLLIMKYVETYTFSQDSTPFQLTIDTDPEKVQVPKSINQLQSYHEHTFSFPVEASKDLDSRVRVSTRANFTNNYKWLVEMTAQVDSEAVYNSINLDDGTEFIRYENVVIATKVHWPNDLKILKRMLCLLKAAYNRFVNYDILVFTTIPWSEEQVLELAEVVAPAKLIVALDGPSLEEHLESMTDNEVMLLQIRCGAENSTLTWMHYCQEENSRHTSNLAYAWQSEFRAYHIWKHPSLQPYKFMMWIDSDALCSKTWERDPMKLMVENNLTILFDNFPGGSLKGDDLVERLMKGYDTSICWIALNEEGSWKLRLCKENTRGTLVPQVHGFFHITNMDVYRAPRHYNFLKLLVGEYRVSLLLFVTYFTPWKHRNSYFI